MKIKVKTLLLHILYITIAFIFLTPLVWSLVSSFKPEANILQDIQNLRAFLPTSFTLENYFDVFRRVPFGIYFINSLIITLSIGTGGLIINAMAAFVFARISFPGRTFLFACIVSLIIIPFESVIIPLFLQINNWGWTNSYKGLIIPFFANAFSIYLLRQAFLDLPSSLFESAELDGCGLFRSCFLIGFPLIKPSLTAAFLIDITTRWGDFLWPLLVSTDETKRPLQLGLNHFFHQPPIQWGDILAYSILSTIPVTLIFILAQKHIVRGVATTGIKA